MILKCANVRQNQHISRKAFEPRRRRENKEARGYFVATKKAVPLRDHRAAVVHLWFTCDPKPLQVKPQHVPHP